MDSEEEANIRGQIGLVADSPETQDSVVAIFIHDVETFSRARAGTPAETTETGRNWAARTSLHYSLRHNLRCDSLRRDGPYR